MSEIALIEEMLREMSLYAAERREKPHERTVSAKRDPNDLLTEVDLHVQREIAARVRAAYPGDAVIGEELGMHDAPADPMGRCWIIDPIDGTQNFVRNLFPIYGISIAFAQGAVALAGGVALPGLREVYLAERGAGSTRNGATLRVSSVDSLEIARAEIDFSSPRHREASLNRFSALIQKAGQVRCHAAAVVGLCAIATGAADLYVNVGLSVWDFAAAMLIAEEAGGRATRLDGSPVKLFDNRKGMLASNGVTHDEALRIIAQGGDAT